jgi:hypothetical protein
MTFTNKTDVLAWAQTANPGETLVYHERDTMDRDARCSAGPQAGSALLAHQMGIVFLSQKRTNGGYCFAYRATRISERTARVLHLSWQRPTLVSSGDVAAVARADAPRRHYVRARP